MPNQWFTSTLSDVLGVLSQSELPPDDEPGSGSAATDRAEHIVAAIAEQARPAVAERREEDEEPADRRLLWLEHRKTLAVAVSFNPMGPTVGSIEVCALPDGTEYLAHFRRHPFAPYHCALGVLSADGNDSQLFSEATDLLIGGSLPNVLALNVAASCVTRRPVVRSIAPKNPIFSRVEAESTGGWWPIGAHILVNVVCL